MGSCARCILINFQEDHQGADIPSKINAGESPFLRKGAQP